MLLIQNAYSRWVSIWTLVRKSTRLTRLTINRIGNYNIRGINCVSFCRTRILNTWSVIFFFSFEWITLGNSTRCLVVRKTNIPRPFAHVIIIALLSIGHRWRIYHGVRLLVRNHMDSGDYISDFLSCTSCSRYFFVHSEVVLTI